MQIRGEDFIKKVQRKQEREELERKLSELEEVEMNTDDEPVILSRNINNMNNNNNNNNNMNGMDENIHELNNIMLGDSEGVANNEENKKKYLILGIVLVVLFLLTIIIIRLLTGDSNEKDQFTSNGANSSEINNNSENRSIEENFQKIINERVKKDSAESMRAQIEDNIDDRLDNIQENKESVIARNEIIEEEEPKETITNRDLDDTIKRIKEKEIAQEEIKKEEKVVEKKPEVKKSIKELVQSNTSEMTKGYFVQIGAFTKKPSASYINNIREEGFKYKVYRVEIKGTFYNKVLIGPYSSRASATQEMDDIKKRLKISNAFILKF